MITLTDSAAKKVNALAKEQGDDSKQLRILVESGGCSGFEYGMSFDVAKDDDQHLEDNGIKFLIDPASLSYLDGSKVDFDDGLHGKGFEVINPNAQSTCGCGRSFN